MQQIWPSASSAASKPRSRAAAFRGRDQENSYFIHEATVPALYRIGKCALGRVAFAGSNVGRMQRTMVLSVGCRITVPKTKKTSAHYVAYSQLPLSK